MEDPVSAHLSSPTSTRSKQGRPSKISQKLSSLKGIIRIPVRRTRDDRDGASTITAHPNSNNAHNLPPSTDTQGVDSNRRNEQHPYGRRTGGGLGLKPYMSQPMLGLPLGHTQDGRHSMDGLGIGLEGYEDGASMSSASASPDHSPARSEARRGGIRSPSPLGAQIPLQSDVRVQAQGQANGHGRTSSQSTAPSAWDQSHSPTRPAGAGHGRKFSFSNALLGRSRNRAGSMDGHSSVMPPSTQRRPSTAQGIPTTSSWAATPNSTIRVEAPTPPSISTSTSSNMTMTSKAQPPLPPGAAQPQFPIPPPPLRSDSTRSRSSFSFLKRPRTPLKTTESDVAVGAGGGVKAFAKTLVTRASRTKLNAGVVEKVPSSSSFVAAPPSTSAEQSSSASKTDERALSPQPRVPAPAQQSPPAPPPKRSESPLPPLPPQPMSASTSADSATSDTAQPRTNVIHDQLEQKILAPATPNTVYLSSSNFSATTDSKPAIITYSSTPALPIAHSFPSALASITTDQNKPTDNNNNNNSGNGSTLPATSTSTGPSTGTGVTSTHTTSTTNNLPMSSTNPPSGALAPNSDPRNRPNHHQFPAVALSPRRTLSTAPGAPRITLPPANTRFSINAMLEARDGGSSASARLSPSIILRPPPLPLLHLPMLTPRSSYTGGNGPDPPSTPKEVARRAVRGMPALPMEGTSRGVRGHEEMDDVEDDDEMEDDEDGDEDESHGQAGSGDMDGDDMPVRSSMSSDRSMDDDEDEDQNRPSSRTSSYETAHGGVDPSPIEPYFGNPNRPPGQRFSRQPHLPRVATSHKLDLDFSFLDQSPATIGGKGKAKEVSLMQDAGRTPVGNRPATTPWGAAHAAALANANANGETDYFYQAPRDTGRSMSESTARMTPVARGPSPARTPRPGDHHGSMAFTATPGLGGIPPMPNLTSKVSEARLGATMGSLSAHPGMYKRASKSLIDVHGLETKERVVQMVKEEEDAEEEERKKRVKALWMSMRTAVKGTPLEEGKETQFGWPVLEEGDKTPKPGPAPTRDPLKTPPHSADAVMAAEGVNAATSEASGDAVAAGDALRKNRISLAPAYDALSHPLRRRRSMPTFNATTAPPPYPDFAPHPHGLQKNLKILPREDEGKEKLPAYTNDIYLVAIMPRKMEFVKPGMQAKDRKWRRVLCVLEGTSFKVYKCPAASGVSAIGEWWESKVGAGDAIASSSSTTAAYHTTTSGSVARGPPPASGTPTRGTGTTSQRDESPFVRETALTRSRKSEEGGETGQPVLQRSSPNQGPQPQSQQPLTPPQPAFSHNTHHSNHSVGSLPKSALSLAVHLLKPASRHTRSNSDVALSSPIRPRSPRSSLNISRDDRSTPAASSTHGSSLRSPSPNPASMTSSTSLTTPSSSSVSMSSPSSASRPLTPSPSGAATASASTSSRSGFRVGAGVHANAANSRHGPSPSSSGSHFHHGKGKEKAKDELPDPEECDLLRIYTMQNAESGLGKDYVKRQHVIRVRLEGEQFLLQAKDVESVISWIEGIQSATNIALDLDERPMPAGPIFPRRRRRRRIPPAGINVNVTAANAPSNTTGAAPATPVSATQLVAPLNRSLRS